MNPDVKEILNSPELLECREYHMQRLERLYAGEKPDYPIILNGYMAQSDLIPEEADPELWVESALTDLSRHADLLRDRAVFHPLCATPWLYGVHFIDRVFGAEVFTVKGQWWSHGMENEVGELPVPDLEHNETWLRAQHIAEASVAAGVSVPFYYTQVLGEPWNQMFNLYKERALVGFFDNPCGMHRDLQLITDVLVEMHKWYIAHIPPMQYQPLYAEGRCQPRGYGQMCGCSTHMISADIYNEFVKSQDERILALYPNGGMFHLCGSHTQHIPTWRSMPAVRAVQVNDRAADDLPVYFRELRPDQMIYVNVYEKMTEAQTLDITEGGRRCVIVK